MSNRKYKINVNAKVSQEMSDALRVYAAKQRLPMSEVVRVALRKELGIESQEQEDENK